MVVVVDSKYNPDLQSDLSATTLLGPGVSIGNFLPNTAYGVQKYSDLSHSSQLSIVRNLVPQVEMINSVNGRLNKFPNNRLAIVEGIYFQGEAEVASGYNSLKEDGRSVVYALYDINGNIDFENTYNLAVYWKEYFEYDEITLSYDTINPDGSLNANIIVTMPSISSSYDVTFDKDINTYFNNSLAFANELVEITL